jgi:hypothetical protein
MPRPRRLEKPGAGKADRGIKEDRGTDDDTGLADFHTTSWLKLAEA